MLQTSPLARALPLFSLLLLLPACFSFGVKGDVGYTSMAISGDMALAPTGGSVGVTIDQDVESALGLGDDSGSPYLRAEFDFGVPVLSVSAFQFSDSGTGTLNGSFGNITAGTQVASDLEFSNVKAALTFDIDLVVVKLSPGIAVDLFDLDLQVQDVAGFAEESVDVVAPVPMLFVRGEAGLLGIVNAVAEVGGLKVPEIDGIEGTFWDAEARIEVAPAPMLNLFVGYRFMHLDGNGNIDNQGFDASLDITGWMLGGGVKF